MAGLYRLLVCLCCALSLGLLVCLCCALSLGRCAMPLAWAQARSQDKGSEGTRRLRLSALRGVWPVSLVGLPDELAHGEGGWRATTRAEGGAPLAPFRARGPPLRNPVQGSNLNLGSNLKNPGSRFEPEEPEFKVRT